MGHLFFIFSFALIAITKNLLLKLDLMTFLKFWFQTNTSKFIEKDTSFNEWFYYSFIYCSSYFVFLFYSIGLESFFFCFKNRLDFFVRIFTFFGIFVLSKFLIEKIIAATFNIEEFIEQFNLQKVSYRTFMGLIITYQHFICFITITSSNVLIYCVIVVILAINLLTYLISLKIYQNLLIRQVVLFYFVSLRT